MAQGMEDYIPLSVRKDRRGTYANPLCLLCNSKGKVIADMLPENIARAYAKAINSYYVQDEKTNIYKPYNCEVILIMDIPLQLPPKSTSKAVGQTEDGQYIIKPDNHYLSVLRKVKARQSQYTVYDNTGGKILRPVWVEFVFHLKTQSLPTLADLCGTGTDLLLHLGILERRYVVSLNNSRIVRDKTERTEITVREPKGGTDVV